MSHFSYHNLNFNFNPPLPKGTRVRLATSPISLKNTGFNLPVEITTASSYREGPEPEELMSLVVMAHFDTGASITSIDIELAKHLNLTPTGAIDQHTAGGTSIKPTFAIDLSFPNTILKAFQNLQIGSCELPTFNLEDCIKNPNDMNNFGILLGRDIMSKWNIVWHGPTSTVIISD